MDQLQALKELAEKVEAGDIEGIRVFVKTFGRRPDNRHLMAWGACGGSLDAAKALHEAVLPGWTVNSLHQSRHKDNGMKPDGTWTCLLFAATEKAFLHQEQKATDPARAWLLAILRAKINELEEV